MTMGIRAIMMLVLTHVFLQFVVMVKYRLAWKPVMMEQITVNRTSVILYVVE